MLRRTFLQTLPLAAAGATLRLSVRVEALFPGLPLERQMELVAECGYDGYEFGDWRAVDLKATLARARQLSLECVAIVGNRGVNPVGMGLCDPRERDGFLAELRASLGAAQQLEARCAVVLTGFRVPGMTREAQHASIVEGLKHAAELAERASIKLVVEPINTRAKIEPLNPKGDNHSRYFLDHHDEAFAIAREVASPRVKILYDFYHAQIMDGNLIETVRENLAEIGHIHVADVPGRHEPGTGEIHFPRVFEAISATAYADYIGMEYVPSRDARATLVETRRMIEAARRFASSRPR